MFICKYVCDKYKPLLKNAAMENNLYEICAPFVLSLKSVLFWWEKKGKCIFHVHFQIAMFFKFLS